jgi:hypothetical protein
VRDLAELGDMIDQVTALLFSPPEIDYLSLWEDDANWETVSTNHLAFVGPNREWPKTCAVFLAIGGWNYLLYECENIPQDTFGPGGFDTLAAAQTAALEHALDIISIENKRK